MDEATKAQASLSVSSLEDLLPWHLDMLGDAEKQAAHRQMYSDTDHALRLAAGWTPEQIEREAAYWKLASGVTSGFTVGGTVQDAIEAKTWQDYVWVALGVIPGAKGGAKAVDALKAAEKVGDAVDTAKDVAKAVEKLSQGQQSAINKIDKIANNFKPDSDIPGLLKDMAGTPVMKSEGTAWNHLQEMDDVLRGLRNHVNKLEGVNNPAANTARQKGLDLINRIESAMRRHGI
jgi:hypothetical protein